MLSSNVTPLLCEPPLLPAVVGGLLRGEHGYRMVGGAIVMSYMSRRLSWFIYNSDNYHFVNIMEYYVHIWRWRQVDTINTAVVNTLLAPLVINTADADASE